MQAEQLKQLLRDFNTAGYADSQMKSETAKYESNKKNGLLLHLVKDRYTYEDEFYGGQPYSGNETIWEDSIPVFRCVYWGKFMSEVPETFLRKALSVGPSGSCVHRGPESFSEGELEYRNECIGSIEEFKQIERILRNGLEVYVAYFYGGRINNVGSNNN